MKQIKGNAIRVYNIVCPCTGNKGMNPVFITFCIIFYLILTNSLHLPAVYQAWVKI